MDMIDPTLTDPGVILVVMGTAIATLLAIFLIIAAITRYVLKVKISVSGFISAMILSVLVFIILSIMGPIASESNIGTIQAYALFILLASILVNIGLLKIFKPKSLEELILTEYKKTASVEEQEHYKNILKDISEIEKIKLVSKQLETNKFSFMQKFKKGK